MIIPALALQCHSVPLRIAHRRLNRHSVRASLSYLTIPLPMIFQLPLLPPPTSSPPAQPSDVRPLDCPPSSFRDSSAPHLPFTPSNSQPRSVSSSSQAPSRSSSRAGSTYTPSFENAQTQPKYVPQNLNDPLDVEVAAIVNAFPHSLHVERVDPPMPARAAPPERERRSEGAVRVLEPAGAKGRYLPPADNGSLDREKQEEGHVSCWWWYVFHTTSWFLFFVDEFLKIGWQELQLYILNRQAGM